MRSDCATCGGDGFVPVDDSAIGSNLEVKPCPRCNQDVYERWATGHFDPNHWCMDCENRRRGRVKADA